MKGDVDKRQEVSEIFNLINSDWLRFLGFRFAFTLEGSNKFLWSGSTIALGYGSRYDKGLPIGTRLTIDIPGRAVQEIQEKEAKDILSNVLGLGHLSLGLPSRSEDKMSRIKSSLRDHLTTDSHTLTILSRVGARPFRSIIENMSNDKRDGGSASSLVFVSGEGMFTQPLRCYVKRKWLTPHLVFEIPSTCEEKILQDMRSRIP